MLFNKNFYVFAIFFIGHVNDLTRHAAVEGLRDRLHLFGFETGCETRADFKPNVNQTDGDVDVDFRFAGCGVGDADSKPAAITCVHRRRRLACIVKAASNFAPSSALILPSSIIFKIFNRSSDVAIYLFSSLPNEYLHMFFPLIHFHKQRRVRGYTLIHHGDHLAHRAEFV